MAYLAARDQDKAKLILALEALERKFPGEARRSAAYQAELDTIAKQEREFDADLLTRLKAVVGPLPKSMGSTIGINATLRFFISDGSLDGLRAASRERITVATTESLLRRWLKERRFSGDLETSLADGELYASAVVQDSSMVRYDVLPVAAPISSSVRVVAVLLGGTQSILPERPDSIGVAIVRNERAFILVRWLTKGTFPLVASCANALREVREREAVYPRKDDELNKATAAYQACWLSDSKGQPAYATATTLARATVDDLLAR